MPLCGSNGPSDGVDRDVTPAPECRIIVATTTISSTTVALAAAEYRSKATTQQLQHGWATEEAWRRWAGFHPTASAITNEEKNYTPDVEKGIIIAFFACLQCITTVAHLVGRPWSTVKSFLVRATERQSLDDLLRSGRPEILTKRQKWAILRVVRKDRRLNHEAVRRQHAPNESLIAVRRLILRLHHLRM